MPSVLRRSGLAGPVAVLGIALADSLAKARRPDGRRFLWPLPVRALVGLLLGVTAVTTAWGRIPRTSVRPG